MNVMIVIKYFVYQKLDEVFGVIRSESVDDIKKTEITIRGMGNIDLNRQKTKKPEVEKNKMDEYQQKKVSRQQIAMPEKPATFKKNKKPSPKEESPKPPPPEPPKEDTTKPVEPPKIKKKTNFVFISKIPTPPKEPTPPPPISPTPLKEKTPDLQTKFWPTPKLPTPEPVAEQEEEDLIQFGPERPLKVGINGFDRIGRLAFRTALESGIDVTAINDPFIPLHYMVYSLKFDMAHSKQRRKDMNVVESPNGQLIVNDKLINVFKEVDPRKIPWNSVGVNYVIEATESLQSKVNAMHHLEFKQEGMTMEALVNKKDATEKIVNGDSEVTSNDECTVKKVIVASNTSEFPSFGIGINDERLSKSSRVICSISAQANAIVLPLKIVQDSFGIKFCSYTFLKAVMGPTKDIKCPTLGPSSHKKVIKWDFSENLVPAPCPSLEEEAVRYLPSL